jgi:hypothetical protein
LRFAAAPGGAVRFGTNLVRSAGKSGPPRRHFSL